MISKTSKPLETSSSSNPSFSSLDNLSAHHLNFSEKKTNASPSFSIPKINFNSLKSSLTNSNATPFTSLADLTAHHLNISSKAEENSTKNTNSPFGFTIPKINTNNQKAGSPSFSYLADLTAHHLKISSETKNNTASNTNSPSPFIIPKITPTSKSDNSPSFGSLAELTAHHLKVEKTSSQTSFVIPDLSKVKREKFSNDELQSIPDSPSGFIIPDLSKVKKEKFLDDESYYTPDSILKDVSNLNLREKLDPNIVIKTEMELSDYPKNIKEEKLEDTNCKRNFNNSLKSTIESIRNECYLNCINNLSQKAMSSFGKVLCKTYRRHMPYTRKQIKKSEEELKSVIHFDFSSPSPDTLITRRIIGIKKIK